MQERMSDELDQHLQSIQEVVRDEPEDMFEDPAYRQEVLWFAYKRQCDILAEAQKQAALYRVRLVNTCPYTVGTRVKYDNRVFYVLKCELWTAMGYEKAPVYWLTLTQLTKNGSIPARGIKTAHTSSTNVEVIGRYGDADGAKYFETP